MRDHRWMFDQARQEAQDVMIALLVIVAACSFALGWLAGGCF